MDSSALRQVNRPLETSKLLQRVFASPLAIKDSYASTLLTAIRGKYGISNLVLGNVRLDEEDMAGMQHQAQIQASARDASRSNGRIFDETEGVAIIPVYGTLTKSWGLDPWCGFTGYDGIEAKVIAAMLDENIKAIWFDIDSGGGDVSGLFDLCDIIYSFNAKNGGKTMFAMCSDYAYSAAYAIASCADKVFVPRTGGCGSVGVITIHATYQRKLEQEGIDVTVIRGGEEKARANMVEQLPEQTRAHIQAQVDTVRDLFVDLVSRNMALSKKTVRETEGLDYMGVEARAIGFATDVCSEHEAWGKLMRRVDRENRS